MNDSIQAFCHGRAGVDEHGGDVVEPAPVGDGVGDELGSVVEPDERRRAPLSGEAVEEGDDGVGVDGAVDDDGWALAGELVDHVEQLEGAAVDGDVELEVQRPQGVRADRAHRPDMGADAGEALLAPLVGHLQPFVTPQPPDPLVVDLPARPAGVLGGPTPSPAWSSPGEVTQELTQLAARRRRSTGGSRRWVERCWPTTRQARRSETPNRSRSTCTARRRRVGVRSFPRRAP